MDLWEVDIRRFMPFQRNRRYLHGRTTETLGLLYDMHWPFRQYETARGVRRTPLYSRLKELKACFGEVAGWERSNWFAPKGVEPKYEYSFKRQNWFPYCAAEVKATREKVALFDQSTFAKFLVQGPDAETTLQKICANNVGVEPGRAIYTQWLNERGGIEADLTLDQVRRQPQGPAVTCGGVCLSYDELETVGRTIAAALRASGVTPGDRVALFLPRSTQMIAGIVGSHLAGAAYVPMNPTYPDARNRDLLADADVAAVLTTSALGGRLPAGPWRSIAVDALEPDAARAADVPGLSPGSLAYIHYTSGSTGRPKGVTLSQRNGLSFVDWCSATFSPAPEDRFSSHAPFHFDLSILDLFRCAGAAVG